MASSSPSDRIMSGAVDVLIQRLTARVAAHDSSDKHGDPTWPVMIGAGDLAAVVEALTTPPARSYADGVADSSRAVEAHAAECEREAERRVPGCPRQMWMKAAKELVVAAAAIRLLSQGGGGHE